MSTCTLEARFAMNNQSVLLVDLAGSLDVNSVMGLEKLLSDLAQQGRFKIALNLEKVTYISSAGIGVLMRYIRHFRHNRGDIKLYNVSGEVYKVFHLLEIPALIQLLNTEQDAVMSF